MQCKNCGAEVGIEYRLCPYCKSEVQYPTPNGQQNQPIIIQNIIQNPTQNQGYNQGYNQNYNNQGYNQNYNNQGYDPNYNQGYNQNYNQVPNNNPVGNFVNQIVGNNIPANGNISPKSKMLTLILAIVLGYFGIHRLYAGRYITGLIYMFTWGLYGLGWIVDIVLILIGRFKDGRGFYILN